MKMHEALRNISPKATLDRLLRVLFRQRVRGPVFAAIERLLLSTAFYMERVGRYVRFLFRCGRQERFGHMRLLFSSHRYW